VGHIEVQAVHTPGHTPEHLCYLITDCGGGAHEPMGIVTGDFVFVGNLGRPDLLELAVGIEGASEPAARQLHASTLRFLALQDHLQVWPAHGSGSACGKALGAVPQSTVGYERLFNPAIAAARESEKHFVGYILAGQPEPPPYFSRMKRLNREGAPVLGALPRPRQLGLAELAGLAGRRDLTLLDTRERDAFMSAHMAGAIHAPLDRSFCTIAGSYADPDLPIHLVVDAAQADEALRSLVRIGLDRIAGCATPETLRSVKELRATESIDWDELERRRASGRVRLVDVRTRAEFEDGHIPGALNVAHTRLAPRLAELPRDGELLVYCATGVRSGAAASFLEREGFRVVHARGQFADWARAHSAAAV
jgi:hydroxyacylglutathione hydrolase